MAKTKMKGVTSRQQGDSVYWYARVNGQRVYCGKGDKGRVVPVTRSAWEEIQGYVERGRPALANGHPDSARALFLSSLGRRLCEATVLRVLRRHAQDPQHPLAVGHEQHHTPQGGLLGPVVEAAGDRLQSVDAIDPARSPLDPVPAEKPPRGRLGGFLTRQRHHDLRVLVGVDGRDGAPSVGSLPSGWGRRCPL